MVFQKRDQFGWQILSSSLCKLTEFSSRSAQSAAQLWREGTITNFELVLFHILIWFRFTFQTFLLYFSKCLRHLIVVYHEEFEL